MNTSVVVWAQEGDPPETMTNVLCWQSYSLSRRILSIPRYLEEHAERFRAKYIAFIYDLSQSNVDGKRVVEHMDKGDGFSFWWMTKLSEKSTIKSKQIYHCLLLMALEEILLKKKPSGLTLHSSDCKLVQTIKRLCQNLKISFICCTGEKTRQSFSILGLRRALPYPLQGLLSLRYVLRRWFLRKLIKPMWFSGDSSIFICSYFADMDTVSCAEGRFYSHQWENLPKYFHDCGRRANWLHHFVDRPGGHSVENGLNWFHLFNRDAGEQGYHAFLETYLSWKGLLRALKSWLWLNRVSWRLRKVRHVFTPNGSAVWLWPFLKDDWFASLRGLTAFWNCLWVELFDAALKDMPHQKIGFYLWENQGWENAFLRGWYRNGHGKIIGVQNTTVAFWHLYNFDDPRSLTASDKNAKPLPNQIALNGPMAWNALIEAEYSVERLTEAEAVRYQYLAKLSPDKLNKQGTDPGVSRFPNQSLPKKILVFGDFLLEKNLDLLRCIENALRLIDSEIFLTFKPHPSCPIKKSDFPALSFNITNKPLADILQDFDVAFSGNVTSAGLDAFLAGLSVIVYLDGKDFNLSPLRGIEGVEFVGDAKELATVIRGNKHQKTSPMVGDFFWLDNQFPRWRRTLSSAKLTSS